MKLSRKEYIEYLRRQAYFINMMADEMEKGLEPSCEWCIDLELPELEGGEGDGCE